MSTTVDTSSTSPSAALLNTVNSKPKAATDSVKADTDKFMTLLVTQLKNQDPLNPLDNAQITSQLAQLSTVTGVNKLNTTLESLKASYQSSESMAATNLINHGVLAKGNTVALTGSKGIFGVNLTTPADTVQIDMKNESGKVVHSISMKGVDAGTLPLVWDGKGDDGKVLPDGQYTIAVSATSAGKALTDAIPLTFGTVASVSTGAGGVKMNVPTIGQLTMADLYQVL